ncbi:mannitol dehydrogenase family protein [Rhodobacterales bacterium HKCCE3408]|nr:mannitol dehydrogenase family protein [Rhodobacterales bacterium HKCCE3408]
MPRLLHLGLGNFHRAHQAWYTAHAGGDWRITGVAMRNAALCEAMRDGKGYTLGIRGADGLRTERIGIHDRVILAGHDPEAVIAAFADPDLRVVTLTITEKGYCLSPTTGGLDLSNPTVVADLTGEPRGALGLLAHGLARRYGAALPPLTVLSCDNLSGNGHRLAKAMADFAAAAGLRIHPDTRFPNSMVDRITPATTDALSAEIAAASGHDDAAPVMTEAFTEWVIEDDFAGPRPEWEKAGAELVPDVAPYEMRKLRLLNAAHSWLAYAGQLAGHAYVHEAMADPALRDGVERLWDEAQATLPEVVLPSTPAYRDALVDRFAVAEMRHSLAQIAVDGSLKLRERVAPLIRPDAQTPQATEAVAAWIAYVLRIHAGGGELRDANAERIAAAIDPADGLGAVAIALSGMIGLGHAPDGWHTALAARVSALAG